METIREKLEKIEEQTLSKYACLSKNSLGRDVMEEECSLRTIFQRDRDRIIHCKSFRRLKHKTQVFLIPEGDHYRTRLTHTLEVSQIARTISKSLRLNEDLTEAIALGHDLGHTPFGHAGEAVLNKLLPQGFEHCVQSVRLVERLERGGEGLNLTKEVRDGILNHRTSGNPKTLEGKVVRISDKIAYINHDIDDAITANILKETDLPKDVTDVIGNTVKSRIDFLIKDIVKNSYDKNDIIMTDEVNVAISKLRKWLFENVYNNNNEKNIAKKEEKKAQKVVEILFNYYKEHIDDMPDEYVKLINKGEEKLQVVADYISGMTDDYAIFKFKELYVPVGWKVR
ncbi:MAG: deoxyguanosinetriphosphate triphosphohydrolase [Lachnospiraceae bacterium]|nr:deoxyguanosinetriphosphate triphosphohydrolase [Lachnospiraceae bacterium]